MLLLSRRTTPRRLGAGAFRGAIRACKPERFADLCGRDETDAAQRAGIALAGRLRRRNGLHFEARLRKTERRSTEIPKYEYSRAREGYGRFPELPVSVTSNEAVRLSQSDGRARLFRRKRLSQISIPETVLALDRREDRWAVKGQARIQALRLPR